MQQQSLAAPPRPPSQQPVSAPLQSFAKMLGSPPRTKAPAAQPRAPAMLHPTTTMVDGEEVEISVPGGGVLAQAVLELKSLFGHSSGPAAEPVNGDLLGETR